ncbi:MAG: hypothetical protein ACK51N_02020, partial [bacterium]
MFSLIDRPSLWAPIAGGGQQGPFIGLRQADGAQEPAGGWGWVNGESFSATSWAPGQPGNNTPGNNENAGAYLVAAGVVRSPQWHDVPSDAPGRSFLLEYPTPAPSPVSDLCASAIALPISTTTLAIRGATQGMTADVVPLCAGAVPGGSGVWFRLVGTGHPVTLSTCANTTFDTVLSVFCASCDALSCVTANDDDCPGGGSRVTFCAEAGREYLVLLTGFSGASGTFELQFSRATQACTDPVPCSPPSLSIPPGAIAEGEPACGNGYVDAFNAGCSATPERFVTLAPGQAVSGRAGTFARDGQDFRDTDWYQFTIPAAAEVRIRGAATFPLQLGLIDGRSGCRTPQPLDLGETRAVAGQEATMTRVLPAGRYVVFVAPSALSGVPCDSPYWMSIETTPAGACAFGTTGGGGCVQLTSAQCTAQGGVYQGDGTGCEAVNYAQTVRQPFVFEDIRTTGTAAPTSDPLWNADDGGFTINLGWPFVFYDRLHTAVRVSVNGYLTFGTEPVDVPLPRAMGDVRPPNG